MTDTETKPAVAIGADHAGFPLKAALAEALREMGHPVLDLGTDGTAAVDYPDFAHAVCQAVAEGRARFGVLVCGTGIGMSIAANRHPAIRCALVHDATGARLTRAHNDANVLAIGLRLTSAPLLKEILDAWFAAEASQDTEDRENVARVERLDLRAG